ncbi:MAG: class I adenylate-forming enzyme family protein [Pseudomonadota bacterium]|jgi:fatty-acyl-CoA synthase
MMDAALSTSGRASAPDLAPDLAPTPAMTPAPATARAAPASPGLLTLAESVAAHARTQPHKLAVRDSRRTLTYAQWDERASRLAQALLGLGLVRGDRVALLAYNAIEWLEIYAAIARAGLVAVPLNFRLAGPEIAYIVEHAEARALIVQDDLRPAIDALRGQLPVEPGRCVLFGGTAHGVHGVQAAPAGWRSYEALIAAAPAAPPEVDVGPQDLFALMYTSGTTGRPKGAMRHHEGNALIALATALEFGLGADDNGLLVMPLCHANSLYFAVTFAMLGATIVVHDRARFDPAELLGLLARERITFTSLVPTHYVMMLELPAEERARHDLSRVGKLLVSSAPARKETKLAILELFPNGRLFELYGSTEAGWVTVLRPHEQLDHLGSVGREWAGSGAIRLLDAEGREVPDGEVGELFSRTAYVFRGYWRNPEKTLECFRGAWCSVGDMACRDAQGFIHLVDRKSNMIISGGENIYPSEVEAVLAAHPAVQDVAVVGMPDPTWGEKVLAAVVARPGHAGVSGDGLRAGGGAPMPAELQAGLQAELEAWCRERIAGYKRPRAYVFLDSEQMPRTATGKLQHRALRDRLVQAQRDEAAR